MKWHIISLEIIEEISFAVNIQGSISHTEHFWDCSLTARRCSLRPLVRSPLVNFHKVFTVNPQAKPLAGDLSGKVRTVTLSREKASRVVPDSLIAALLQAHQQFKSCYCVGGLLSSFFKVINPFKAVLESRPAEMHRSAGRWSIFFDKRSWFEQCGELFFLMCCTWSLKGDQDWLKAKVTTVLNADVPTTVRDYVMGYAAMICLRQHHTSVGCACSAVCKAFLDESFHSHPWTKSLSLCFSRQTY